QLVGPERGNPAVHGVAGRLADSNCGDDCGDAKEDAQGREDRPQAVRADTAKRGLERAQHVHAATASSMIRPSRMPSRRVATDATAASWVMSTMVRPLRCSSVNVARIS